MGLLPNANVNLIPLKNNNNKKRLYTFVQMQVLNIYAIMHTVAYKRRI